MAVATSSVEKRGRTWLVWTSLALAPLCQWACSLPDRPNPTTVTITNAWVLLPGGTRVREFNGQDLFAANFPLPNAIHGVRLVLNPPVTDETRADFMRSVQVVDAENEILDTDFIEWAPDGGEVTLKPRGRLGFRRAYQLATQRRGTVNVETHLNQPETWFSVRAERDINGDGYGDLAVGAPPDWQGIVDGSFYVFDGHARGFTDCDIAQGCTNYRTVVRSSRSSFASALANVGDLNADGYADIAVSSTNAAVVFLGSANGITSCTLGSTARCPVRGSDINGSSTTTDSFGAVLAPAGDVDGDGFDDLLVSDIQPYSNDEVGTVRIFFGSDVGIARCNLDRPDECGRFVTIEAAESTKGFGGALGAGDFNDDGYSDVVIGAREVGKQGPGQAVVIEGSATPDDCDLAAGCIADATLSGAGPLALFGTAVGSAGDVNGDGYDDLLVGAPNFSPGSGAGGQAYVFSGSDAGISSCALAERCKADTTLTRGAGAFGTSTLGGTVTGAGDLNGDGFDDIVVGAWGSGTRGYYYFLGRAAGIPDCDMRQACEAPWTVRTISVNSPVPLGDVNGNGIADVGVPELSLGKAYVLSGIGREFSECAASGCPNLIGAFAGPSDTDFGVFY